MGTNTTNGPVRPTDVHGLMPRPYPIGAHRGAEVGPDPAARLQSRTTTTGQRGRSPSDANSTRCASCCPTRSTMSCAHRWPSARATWSCSSTPRRAVTQVAAGRLTPSPRIGAAGDRPSLDQGPARRHRQTTGRELTTSRSRGQLPKQTWRGYLQNARPSRPGRPSGVGRRLAWWEVGRSGGASRLSPTRARISPCGCGGSRSR